MTVVQTGCGAALAVVAMLLCACSPEYRGPPRVLLDWFPQAEQGGIWEAGLDPAGGMAIAVRPGGPRIQTIPQVAAGEAEFGTAPADDILIARMNGAPVKAIAAMTDHVPYVLLYHPDETVRSVDDLRHRIFAVSLGASYWEWLKATRHLAGVRQMPISGDLGLFRSSPDMVQQGMGTTLPFRMAEAGLTTNQIRIADLGYRPYWVLFTRDDLLVKRPALVNGVVAAIKRGWARFADDPQIVERYILKANQQITPAVQRQTVHAVVTELEPADRSRIGCMNDARWRELAAQLRTAGLLRPDFDERQAYSTAWVAGCR